MAKIVKSSGFTPSERFLANLAERSFLSLWAYPNVFRTRAKELCDLLVVCGDHVLVFSDKSIDWPQNVSDELAWSRWYRRAVAKSAKQLSRAVEWIKRYPTELYLDAQCEQRFPIELPSADNMQIHGIIVARGAGKACMKHFGSGSGSLGLMPMSSRTRGPQDTPPIPFMVGNPSPTDETMFHILDDVTLGVLLRELDTITDFTDYLKKKERLILGDHLLSAHGEEDLLSIYLKDLNEDGHHDFVFAPGRSVTGEEALMIEGGSYDKLRKRAEYRRKKTADRQSYLWDGLIETFARNIISDTTYRVRGYEGYHEPTKRELGLRHMALVNRLERRSHAIAIRGAFESIGKNDRFFRAMIPGESYADRSTGFFILLVKRDSFLRDKSDEEYRIFRANLSIGYALNLLKAMPHLDRVVGIATEGELKRKSRSEDMIYAEQPEWTRDYIREVEDMAVGMEIFKNGPPLEANASHIRPFEYPPSHYPSGASSLIPYRYVPEDINRSNRRSRRAAKAKGRRTK